MAKVTNEAAATIIKPAEQTKATNEAADEVKPARLEGFVYAKKNEARNVFSQLEWDALGADKNGWTEDVEIPAEVAKLANK